MPLIILFFALPAFALSLDSPQWINEEWRYSHYPNSEWYVGFAVDRIKEQPNSKTYQSIEREAQNKLSESILIKLQGNAELQTSSRQFQSGSNFSEQINTNYNQNIKTQTNAVLAKVDVKSYFNRESGEIYAFASVKKKDLANFYRSEISALFSNAEKELSIAGQLAETGKKKAAIDKVLAVEDSLKNVSSWGSLLQAVESDNSYLAQESELWQRASDAKMQLQNGTSIYLEVSGDNIPSGLEKTLGAQLQESNCNCTLAENESGVDYVVTIRAERGSCAENKQSSFGEIYCYANANMTVNNPKYNKPVNVKIPQAKGGWGNRNREKATEKAFEDLVNLLAEKIVQTINR